LVPPLGGFYQSERAEGYIVQMGIQPEDNSFVEYIENREVDRGTYEEKSDNTYLFKGEKQEFEITLSPEDSFEVVIEQINNGEAIELKNMDKTPGYISTKFDDVEKYEELLNEE
ncbi:MAG: hypothetical protein L0L39_06775, partial [Atopostipes suicloacalis]|nr:hypothetical protein [Atopostipes suicloacalis]